jgi:tRNA(Arg) A34 adenosine deaminase TadA
MNEQFMREAIRLARNSVESGGGPFGAVIARAGRIVAQGANRVTADHDPTAHAEVVAIRDACRSLGTWSLADCEIYCSCEPCPMCLAAIYWARMDKLFYAAQREDAADAGFSDELIYKELGVPIAERQVISRQLFRADALEVFRAWKARPDKVMY